MSHCVLPASVKKTRSRPPPPSVPAAGRAVHVGIPGAVALPATRNPCAHHPSSSLVVSTSVRLSVPSRNAFPVEVDGHPRHHPASSWCESAASDHRTAGVEA